MGELAKLIAPTGDWGKVWLATHWDRKLKKEDYLELDLRKFIISIAAKRSMVSLRATGHLLLGACKIYAKKCGILEEEADEVRTRLMMAFSRPTTNQQVAAEEVPVPLREVKAHAPGVAPDNEALLGGKKHVARLEDITLRKAVEESIVPTDTGDDLFGALSEKDLEEVMRTMRKKVLPRGALEDLESITAEGGDYDTLPLVALSDQVQGQADSAPIEFGEDAGDDLLALDLDMPALDDQAPQVRPGDALSPVQYQDGEEEQDLDQVAGEAAMQLVPLTNPMVARQLLQLGEDERDAVLNFFPPVRREEVRTLLDEAPEQPVGAIADPGGGGGSGGFGGGFASGAVAPFQRSGFGLVHTGDVEGVEGPVKKARKSYFLADEVTEIPREEYQGYMNDRSSITRKTVVDYSIVLPHYSPNLPNFTTSFTDFGATLCEAIRWGSEVAEKRRRISQDPDFPGYGAGFAGGAPGAAGGGEVQVPEEAILTEEQRHNLSLLVKKKAEGKLQNPFQNLLGPVLSPDKAGLRSPGARDEPVMTESVLLENAPASMSGVVTGNQDDEDQSGNPAARIGYSGRTEKMHRFLAKEFNDSGSQDLSYQSLCKSQTQGRRELIAGCFFELLVLKTNGVISIDQEVPEADIKISKARQWAK